jgi:hypothetical protein
VPVFVVVIYIAVIILFIFLRINKQKKDAKRRTGAPPVRSGSAGGGRDAWTPGQPEARGRLPEGSRLEQALPDILRKLLSGEELNSTPPVSVSAGDDSEEDDSVVEAAWKVFRPGGELESPKEIPRAPRPALKSVPAENASAGMSSPAFPPQETRPGMTGQAETAPRSGQPFFSAIDAESATPDAAGSESAAGHSRAKTASDFSSRLARLRPLQQAIVMSEVLGKPKALSGEDI